MTRYCTIYVTAPDMDEAELLASTLLNEHLIACANILPGMTSLYRWQGEVNCDSEVAILMKTRAVLAEAVTERVRQLHSYDCPCVTVWPIEGGNTEYLNWIKAETEGGDVLA